jgi:hypothetical protein
VYTDGTCDCVKVILILKHDRTVGECLLTVRVTVLR